jgi:hypothetical protein
MLWLTFALHAIIPATTSSGSKCHTCLKGNIPLLTLEPGISMNQTDEMKAKQLQLILPRSIHATYRENQRRWLMTVGQFLELIESRQMRPKARP